MNHPEPQATARTRAAMRRWRPAPGPLLSTVANFAIVTLAALTTAALALIVEDLVPLKPPRQVSPERATLLAAALALLFAAVLWRSLIHRRTGTLFYVRLLADDMPDLHDAAIQIAARRRMSIKSVTRWADLPTHTHQGVIDLSATCADIAAALEMVVNTDRDDTAYTIAPNILWPAALAIGAELPIVDNLQLLELPDPRTPKPITFTLTKAVTPATLVTEELPLDATTPDAPVGLILAFAPAAAKMSPQRVFGEYPVSQCRRIRPAAIDDVAGLGGRTFTGPEVAAFVRPLADAVMAVQNEAGTHGVVIAAAMPKVLAMAIGWHLAQANTRFFDRTHLLHYDQGTNTYIPIRTHPAQAARRLPKLHSERCQRGGKHGEPGLGG
ncbi:hypothetical protein ACFYMB_31435 [Micromonospora haikouensis]|uniref:hypothetical protein n=1 Tax=Micromonospora haikouensis TaxID=686309 RepID=UPI0036A557AE